ncbi:ankyrin repeat-containing domain protein [Massariosphaeria phaeospora]|uniref:Ankyrin repeat-containing domain protein n=1 Tax=Massariosphaeria phaeospora TaxID=100035 RepID=A0A7C8I5X8_9PLEO|nr:ankyrin repeat-containing domain protein [Massariosphaeria phaeospora]
MEPVSLAASIITLVSATSATSTALARLWGARGVPDYVATALNEVTDFKAMLKVVHSVVNGVEESMSDDIKAELERLLGRAKTQLEVFATFLDEKVLKESGGENGPRTKLRRSAVIREAFGDLRDRINALREELVSIKIGMGVTISAMNTQQLRSIPTLLMSIQQISLVRPGDLPVSSLPSTTANETPHVIETIMSGDSNHNIPCHVPYQGSSPRWLRGLIGSMFCTFTGTPVLNYRSCNVPQCGAKQGRPGSLRFQYFFPTWLLPVGIQVSGDWLDLSGLGASWTLKIPRFVTEVWIYRRCYALLEQDSALEVQKFMAMNRIAANDVLSFGENLFELALISGAKESCLLMLEQGLDPSIPSSQGVTLAQLAWHDHLSYGDSASQALTNLPQINDEFDDLAFNALHKIVLELTNHDLTEHIDLHPNLVFEQDCFGYTPLHWASQRLDVKSVDVLVKAGADTNATCREGRSTLMLTAEMKSSKACCKLLIDAGANVNHTDAEGKNALFCAIRTTDNVDLETVTLLLDHGVDIDRSDQFGATCLQYAAVKPDFELCKILLDYGANIEAENRHGVTAIFDAVRHNRTSAIRTLNDRGANLNKSDKLGQTLVHYAALYSTVETMQIMQEWRIQGLRMDPEDVDGYWHYFDQQRDNHCNYQRSPPEVERSAFQALLNSIIPCTAPKPDPCAKTRDIPGAFPAEEDRQVSDSGTTQDNDAEDTSEGEHDEYHDTVRDQAEPETAGAGAEEQRTVALGDNQALGAEM